MITFKDTQNPLKHATASLQHKPRARAYSLPDREFYLQSREKRQHHASRAVHRVNSVLREETDIVGRFP